MGEAELLGHPGAGPVARVAAYLDALHAVHLESHARQRRRRLGGQPVIGVRLADPVADLPGILALPCMQTGAADDADAAGAENAVDEIPP